MWFEGALNSKSLRVESCLDQDSSCRGCHRLIRKYGRLLARYLYQHCLDRCRLEVHGQLFPKGTLKKKAVCDCFQWVEHIVEEQISSDETWAPDRFFTLAACAHAIKLMIREYGLQSSIPLNRRTFKTWLDEQAKCMQTLCIRQGETFMWSRDPPQIVIQSCLHDLSASKIIISVTLLCLHRF